MLATLAVTILETFICVLKAQLQIRVLGLASIKRRLVCSIDFQVLSSTLVTKSISFISVTQVVFVFTEPSVSVPEDKYLHSIESGGCCVSSNLQHQRCDFTTSNIDICRNACDQDELCKGYGAKYGMNKETLKCFVATSAKCNEKGGWLHHTTGNGIDIGVGNLDPYANCANSQDKDCFIKQYGNMLNFLQLRFINDLSI